MKIKELIEELQKLDPELTVFVSGYEGGYDYANIRGEVEDYALDTDPETWYYGNHSRIDDDEDLGQYEGKVKVKGICL